MIVPTTDKVLPKLIAMIKAILLFTLLFIVQVSFGQKQRIRVVLNSVVNYGQHEDFARRAAAALEQVLNSDEFRTRMLAMTYKRTNDSTNEQLYETIMRVHEIQGEGGKNGVVDLTARTLRTNGDERNWANNCNGLTIGIDGNRDGVTAICPNKLETWANANRIDELAGHFAYEYMHILGFGH